MIKELKKTTIGGGEIVNNSAFSDEELNLAFCYLYRLQSLRYNRDTSLTGMSSYTIRPAGNSAEVWEFVSLSEDIPVCITPEFEMSQMISMAKTALTVTEALKKLRMADISIEVAI